MLRLTKIKIFYSLWPILLLAVVAVVVLYQDRFSASNLDVVPDSTEYVLAAHRFATAGEYKILVEGRWLPPRYPPWFSVFALAPAYLFLGPAIGNAIYPITIFGVTGIVIAFLLGKKIGGDWGGTIGALAVLALPTYRMWSRFVMTDVPAAVLMLGACLLYLRLRTGAQARSIAYLLPGFVIAVAALFRPVCAAAVFPFLVCAVASCHWALTVRNLAFLGGPLVLAGAASMTYNAIEFGSPFRNGYHFWVPVPYDYAHLTFSLSYVAQNFAMLWKTDAILLMSVAVVMWAIDRWGICSMEEGNSRPRTIRWIGEFILLGCVPIVLFHLIYFFPSDRFYLPILILLAVTIGGMVGAWLGRLPRAALLGTFALALFWAVFMHSNEIRTPYRRMAVDEILQHTPKDSWIISGIEPAYLEYLVARESQRRIVPISRGVEYAGKIIAPEKIPDPDPPPQSWRDHRCAGLLRGGAQEAVRFVAAEQLDSIAEQQARGTRVFIDLLYVVPADQPILDELNKRFIVVPLTKTLFELRQQN
ncbi:MAG: glycosyltransferase family 39 protein [Proteobacteria bacterium]|nr:glycosyltransferase family 39 protein [Pseudomonadota bacterium]